MDVAVIDFETLPIQQRPDYPPKPVGLAFDLPGEYPVYLSWGHASGVNNSSEHEARAKLQRVWDSGLPVVCHNAKFDLAVALERWGFPMLPWQRIHDTMILNFLVNPYTTTAALKPLSEKLLGMPPDERDAVAEWVWGYRESLSKAYPQYGGVKRSKTGAWIFAAPAELVAPYAVGDVVRTRRLFELLHPIVQRHSMEGAYARERQLMPILMQMERLGMHVDTQALASDVQTYSQAFEDSEAWLRKELHASGLNLDADRDVASVLVEQGIVDERAFTHTKSGQLSVSKDTLMPSLFTGANGQQIASVMGYRNRLATCLKMFMQPWLAQASRTGGIITTNWNQVRGEGGTRTGRPSTSGPNFLNLSKGFEGRDDGYVHPTALELPPLPLVRKYVLPDPGHVCIDRDFSGQELRVFGHFESGALNASYIADPDLDVHDYVGHEFEAVAHRSLPRTNIKIMNFLSIYGGGAPALAAKLRCSLAEAQNVRKFHDKALPGRKILNDEILRIVRRGAPIRTWGGRLYFMPPPAAGGGSGEYKLLNYLIQGSAADLTKQVMIDWHCAAGREGRLLMQVYDELLASVPIGQERAQMKVLKDVMEQDYLSVPLRSDGKVGPAWGAMTKVDY